MCLGVFLWPVRRERPARTCAGAHGQGYYLRIVFKCERTDAKGETYEVQEGFDLIDPNPPPPTLIGGAGGFASSLPFNASRASMHADPSKQALNFADIIRGAWRRGPPRRVVRGFGSSVPRDATFLAAREEAAKPWMYTHTNR